MFFSYRDAAVKGVARDAEYKGAEEKYMASAGGAGTHRRSSKPKVQYSILCRR